MKKSKAKINKKIYDDCNYKIDISLNLICEVLNDGRFRIGS